MTRQKPLVFATGNRGVVAACFALLSIIGELLYARSGKLFLGVEFAIWHNEFGIKGVDEFVPQLAIQYSF